MANIFLSMPVMDRPELRCIQSVYQAILSCPDHRVRLFFNSNDSLISRVRNVHISTFLHDFKECEYFMSIDSDIEIVNAYANNNIFSKLVANNVDFTGALYPVKKQGVRRSSSITLDGSDVEFETGLKEMRWLSSGCWCIKRSAVEKLVKSYPELDYDGDDNATGKKIHGVYIPMIYDLKPDDFPEVKLPFKKYLSEDWACCERWKAIGGKIYADTSIALKHLGKFDYTLFDIEVKKVERPANRNIPPVGFDLPKGS